MRSDQILRKVLANPKLKEKYWPELTDPNAQNLNTLLLSNNVYLKYLHSLFSEASDPMRRNTISKLLN